VGVEVRDPNRLRFTLDGSPDRFPSTDWYVYCSDANFNSWSRTGSANRKTPFTKEFDVPDDSVTCDFDVGAYHFRRGTLSLTLQKR
jgi:hypothetical protein